jgi:hypothetical protein
MENPMSYQPDTTTAELLTCHQQLQSVYYKRANALRQEQMIARHIAAFNAEIETLEKRRGELAEQVSETAVRLFGVRGEAVRS